MDNQPDLTVSLQRALRKAISELDDALLEDHGTSGENRPSFGFSFGKLSNRDIETVEAGGGLPRQGNSNRGSSNSSRGHFVVKMPTWGAGKVAATD